jgi:hypothetical protein
MVKKISTIIFLALFTISTPAVCENKTNAASSSIVKSSYAIGKSVALMYFEIISYLIMHELGHAAISKLFTGSNIDIKLGIAPSELGEKEPILKTDWLKLYSFFPLRAYSKHRYSDAPYKNFLICTAGGIFGAMQNYLFFSAIAARNKYQECKDLKQSILFGLRNAFSPFKNIHLNKNLNNAELYSQVSLMIIISIFAVNRLFYTLTPTPGLTSLLPSVYNYADGVLAWKFLGASTNTLQIACVTGWIIKWILMFIILKKAYNCIKNYPKCQNVP